MPILRLANLGSTPETPEVSVAGGLYVLMTENPATAIVFDLRRYTVNPPSDEYKIKFKQIGDFEIAILPKSRLVVGRKGCACHRPFEAEHGNETLKKVKKVFVINLSRQEPANIGWRHLERLFPSASIANVPTGRLGWRAIAEDERNRSLIETIESAHLVDRGEKIEIGPFALLLFKSKTDGSMNVLVSGESLGRPFTLFFADEKFREFFRVDEVDLDSVKLHTLSAGRWFAFYANP